MNQPSPPDAGTPSPEEATAVATKRATWHRFGSLAAAGVTFLISLAAGSAMVWQAERHRVEQYRTLVADLAGNHAHAIKTNIERALSATFALAALVRHGNGNVLEFESTANQMLAFYPGAASLQLAPGGVVRRIVPLEGNEKAIGHNLLQDPVRNKEAFLARDTGHLTLAGPFELLQGGLGAVGRLPVFLGQGEKQFWGFTTVLIRFPEVLRDVRLHQMAEAGYGYVLWRIHPDSAERQIIARFGPELPSDPVDQALDLPNGQWTLSVAPLAGWEDRSSLALRGSLALLVSLLLAFVAKLLFDLHDYKEDLERRVDERTAQLATSEQRVRNMSDAAGAYLWEVDMDLVYTHVSGRSASVKGYPPEALLGHTPMEFMPAEDVEHVAVIVNRAIAEKTSFRLQHRDITPSGELWWEEVYGAVFCNARGEVVGLRGTGMGINLRKWAEEELRKGSQRFRDIAEISGDWIWEIDKEGKYSYVSEGVRRMLGYAPEEVLGRTPFDFMAPAEAAAVGEKFSDIARQRVPFNDLENVVLDREGRPHVTLTSGTPIFGRDGELVGYRGVDRDVTSRKEAEGHIERLRNLYAALSDCNQAIVRCTSAEELFEIICGSVVDFGGMRMAWIGLLDEADGMVKAAAKSGSGLSYLDGIRISTSADDPFGHGPVGTALREDRPVWNQDFLNDPLTEPWWERARQYGWKAAAALPLHRDGKVIGAFALYAGETNAFDLEARLLLEEMAADISHALDGFDRDASIALAAKVFEQGKEGIMITDAAGRIVRVNRAFTEISGYAESEAIGQPASLLSSGRQGRDFYRDMWQSINGTGHWQGEIWNRRKEGTIFPEWLAISRVDGADGEPSNYVGIFSDISTRKEAEAHIQRLAHFDALTGLPNRALLHDRARQALGLAQRTGTPLVVMFVDLDHFKNINDSLGHRIGDELLVEVGRRMTAATRKEDTVSRQGGDEFVVILPGTDGTSAALVARKLIDMISVSFNVEQHELTVTPSIGIAVFPDDGGDFEALSRAADAAMYRAKRDGRNGYRFFTPEMQQHSVRTLKLEGALRFALARDELRLCYQPQISVADGRVLGAEALLRWHHPELGEIMPSEFVTIAENCGAILSIGEWVMRTAARQMKAWIDAGTAPEIMAVNLSAAQFRQSHLPELVARILSEEGLTPEHFELELTETAAMDDPLSAINVMDGLYARGIRLSIDDFGTGYSSLSYLKRFPVYKLKIDQSFVGDLSADSESQAIIRAVISLAGSLGLRTIAEGVETLEQLEFLRQHGCNEVQGFYFSPPVSAEELARLVVAATRPVRA